MKAAVDCAAGVMQSGIPIARCELLDAASIRAVNDYSQMDLTPQPTLLFEFHGTKAGVQEQVPL